MKKFIKKIKSNKFLYILSVLIVGVFFILIARVTYAFLAPIINNAQTNIVIKGDTVDEFKLKVGNPLKLDATPTTLKENGTNYTTNTTATASLKANSTKNTATYNYYLYFQIENNTFTYTSGTTPEIILTITNPNGEEVTSIEGLTYGTFNGVSGFDVTTQSGLFNIANNYSITSNSSTTATIHEWIITLTYLNQSYDQSANFGKSMEVTVLLQKNAVIYLNDYIKSLYTGTQGDNNIYYHDSSLTNGAGDSSYRYAGASSSVNNFVCFGNSENVCPDDSLYRIIGVIDGKVKLIKYNAATSNLLGNDGEYYTDYKFYWNDKVKVSGYRVNSWSSSLLNTTNLNNNFINNIGEEWANKIATTTWKVGGNTSANISEVIPSVSYQNEIANPASDTIYEAKIGLMYLSEYGFAAAPAAWETPISNYGAQFISGIIQFGGIAKEGINWMFSSAVDEWTISRVSDVSGDVFCKSSVGGMGTCHCYFYYQVRPVFNLVDTILYLSGTGTSSDPIRIN